MLNSFYSTKSFFSSERGLAEGFSDFQDFTCIEPETFVSLQDNHPGLLLKQLLLSDVSSFEQRSTKFIEQLKPQYEISVGGGLTDRIFDFVVALLPGCTSLLQCPPIFDLFNGAPH